VIFDFFLRFSVFVLPFFAFQFFAVLNSLVHLLSATGGVNLLVFLPVPLARAGHSGQPNNK